MKAVKEFVVPAAVLTVICLVVSAALAGTYQLTEPVIEAAKRAEADQSRVVVLPDGQNFEQVPADGLENIVEAYKAGNGAGYVITGKAKGYGHDLEVTAVALGFAGDDIAGAVAGLIGVHDIFQTAGGDFLEVLAVGKDHDTGGVGLRPLGGLDDRLGDLVGSRQDC